MTEYAASIVLQNNRALVIFNENAKSWDLPQTIIKEGEIVVQTADRIMRECGVRNPRFITNLGTFSRGPEEAPTAKVTAILFKTENDLDDTEIESRWVRIDAVPSLLSYDEDKEFFLSVINKINSESEKNP